MQIYNICRILFKLKWNISFYSKVFSLYIFSREARIFIGKMAGLLDLVVQSEFKPTESRFCIAGCIYCKLCACAAINLFTQMCKSSSVCTKVIHSLKTCIFCHKSSALRNAATVSNMYRNSLCRISFIEFYNCLYHKKGITWNVCRIGKIRITNVPVLGPMWPVRRYAAS